MFYFTNTLSLYTEQLAYDNIFQNGTYITDIENAQWAWPRIRRQLFIIYHMLSIFYTLFHLVHTTTLYGSIFTILQQEDNDA